MSAAENIFSVGVQIQFLLAGVNTPCADDSSLSGEGPWLTVLPGLPRQPMLGDRESPPAGQVVWQTRDGSPSTWVLMAALFHPSGGGDGVSAKNLRIFPKNRRISSVRYLQYLPFMIRSTILR